MDDLIATAEVRARDVLRQCVAPEGIHASAAPGGYDQVWARDSMIVAVAACAVGLTELAPAIEASLETLTRAQSPLGYVPLNVHAGGRRDQGDPGGIDSNLWYVIGHQMLHRAFGAAKLLARHREAIERAMLWARYQDSDDDGLIEAQEAADWADLLANRGKVLYSNVLYAAALRAYADLADDVRLRDGAAHVALADRVVARLRRLHWVEAPLGLVDDPVHSDEHAETRRIRALTGSQLWRRPYFLPWVGFRDFGDWCDVLGNSLAILTGVATELQRAAILDYCEQVGVASPVPAKAIHPPILPGSKDWRDYYRNGDLSMPHQYHNGGAWPFIGGFLIAACVADGRLVTARAYLERLAAALLGDGDPLGAFNEWHHGQTGRAMGKPLQAWSAAMFLFAKRAVDDGHAPWPLPRRRARDTELDQSRLIEPAPRSATDVRGKADR